MQGKETEERGKRWVRGLIYSRNLIECDIYNIWRESSKI